jgi:Mg2+ and Co2+ transporter CorA
MGSTAEADRSPSSKAITPGQWITSKECRGTVPVSEHDLAVARSIAAEVHALDGRRRTWRKVTSILDRFEVYRLTSGARERLTEALLAAGLDLEPSLLEADRYSTVRLNLLDSEAYSVTDAALPEEHFLSVSHWRPGEAPAEAGLADPLPSGAIAWIDVDGSRGDPRLIQRALETRLGNELTLELTNDLMGADEFPQVRQIGTLRIVSAFSVVAVESESEAGDEKLTKAGELFFQPVEFVVGSEWLVTCWQGDDATRADDLIENMTHRWRAGDFRTSGDLALLALRELAATYTDARRELYAWLESWELDFTKRHEKTEIETLTTLRSLIAEFRKQLSPLQRSDLTGNPSAIWFPGVTDPNEADRVDDLIDRALRDLRALGEALLTAISLSTAATATAQSRQAERFQRFLGAVAAVLLVPTLVATVFGANTWLPGERRWSGFATMLVLMAVTAVSTWLALLWREKRQDRPSPPAAAAERLPRVSEPSAPATDRDESASDGGNPAVAVYEYLATDPSSRTPQMLKLFAISDLLTPEEIGRGLAHTNEGNPLTPGQARAILRNLGRAQGNLMRAGRLTREILVKEFANYDAEGAGRYGLSPEDRKALRDHLRVA